MSFRIPQRDSELPNLVKIGHAKLPKGPLDYHTKKLGLRGIRPSPHFAQNGPIAHKISERCYPLTCPRIPNLVRIGCALPDLFRKD